MTPASTPEAVKTCTNHARVRLLFTLPRSSRVGPQPCAEGTIVCYNFRVFPRKKGMTLPELLIAMTLTGVVLTLVYPILSGTVRAMVKADADTQTQQKAVLLVEKFFADFSTTNRSSLTILDSVPAASFLSQRPLSQNGLTALRRSTDYYPSDASTYPVLWTKFVAIAFNAPEKKLERFEFPYTEGPQLACITPNQLAILLADPRYAGTQRTVVRGIESLKLRAIGDSSVSVELTSRETSEASRSTNIQVILSMRN